jgi:DNA-binding PadR family transcriptional regulator
LGVNRLSKLIILGLLKNKAMHGYEIQSIIQVSRVEQWANVLSGSIYYALNKMEEEGIIETVKEERTGARIRKIYGITTRGEEEYQRLLKEQLQITPHSLKSDFMVSLALIEQLPKEDATLILESNLRQLERNKLEWQNGQMNKSITSGYNTVMEYAFDCTLEIIDADIKLVTNVLEYLKKK